MIQTLNLILLTSVEFVEMRRNLKDLSNAEHKSLFVELYKTWCYNPAATFSLCLIAEVYHHAYDLVCAFASLEITVNFLIEMDKLVQLVESPIFTGQNPLPRSD
jgi:vacuole morphology and inheritance protein 14